MNKREFKGMAEIMAMLAGDGKPAERDDEVAAELDEGLAIGVLTIIACRQTISEKVKPLADKGHYMAAAIATMSAVQGLLRWQREAVAKSGEGGVVEASWKLMEQVFSMSQDELDAKVAEIRNERR